MAKRHRVNKPVSKRGKGQFSSHGWHKNATRKGRAKS